MRRRRLLPSMVAAQDAINGSFAFDFALPWHGPILPGPGRGVKRNPGQMRPNAANPGPGGAPGKMPALPCGQNAKAGKMSGNAGQGNNSQIASSHSLDNDCPDIRFFPPNDGPGISPDMRFCNPPVSRNLEKIVPAHRNEEANKERPLPAYHANERR